MPNANPDFVVVLKLCGLFPNIDSFGPNKYSNRGRVSDSVLARGLASTRYYVLK